MTAYHVVTAYRACRDTCTSTRLVIRNVDLSDREAHAIDGDAECDVAFRVSDEEFQAIDVRPFRSEPDRWRPPPPPPAVGRGVFFTGYPEVDRRVLRRNAVEFLQQSNGRVAAGVEADAIEVKLDPEYFVRHIGQPPPSTTKSLSGYSGSPLMVVSAGLGPPFWLGGIIIKQMHALTDEQPTHVWARRPGCILPIGKLCKPLHVRHATAEGDVDG